jgi:hypothetical protein
MMEDVTQRLASFGYDVTGADAFALGFVVQKVESHILDSCGIAEIPEGLRQTAADMAAGEFLMGKKASGQLDGSAILDSEAVSSIKLGDTQVDFGEPETASRQLDSLIAFLMKGREADLVSYRRMKW